MDRVNYGLQVATGPTVEPLTADEARRYLRIEHSDENELLESLITLARETVEYDSRRSILTQTLDLTLDQWQNVIELPRPPVQSVTWIKYYDSSNVQQTLSASDYGLDIPRAFVYWVPNVSLPTLYDRPAPITVRYVTGYTAASEVPQRFKQIMLLMLGTIYQNRVAPPSEQRQAVPEAAYYALLDRVRYRSYP